jgi:glycosyltransferase involved in cell wall biosynthesis
VPRVSVGMPVYNGAATFERAIAAVLGQTLGDLEVIVSDNASTDTTGEIACRHAARDPRVRYVRQQPALTGYDNFRFVLREARAPYFVWAAADDALRPSLLERACALLDARPDVVCCVPRVDFVNAEGRVTPAAGTRPLLGDIRDRVRAYLRDPADNSRFYGLYRREALVRAVPEDEFYGVDWAIVLGTLLAGKHDELPEVLLVREASEPAKYVRLIETYYAGSLTRFAALVPFTRHVVRRLRPPLSSTALFHLLRLNVWFHLAYCRRRHPWYGAPAWGVVEAIDRVARFLFGRRRAVG